MSKVPIQEVPLCVDLDGTLLSTDMLLESLICLIKVKPLCVFLIPFWLFRGKANLKAQIAYRVELFQLTPPFNNEVVSFVTDSRKKQKTILVTGTHQTIADHVGALKDLFDEVKGSDDSLNLTAENKTSWLVDNFGVGGFDYIGNDRDDIPVWKAARNALVVSPKLGIASRTGINYSRHFVTVKPTIRDYLGLIRVHQWIKNALIFVPFILDHRLPNIEAMLLLIVAFFAMSFMASATYIVNDMLDLNADRQNETKRLRVLASGKVPLLHGFFVIAGLSLFTGLCMLVLPSEMNWLLLTYLSCTLLYSFLLKQSAILDVVSIAFLHTLRVVAGTVVIQAQWSFWLLAFSMFMFFSLAMAKRVSELTNLKNMGKVHTIGRDYQVDDIPVLIASGVSTGFSSILVVALYINSDKSFVQYGEPSLLWFLCPVLMYWVGRIWLITGRGQLHEDPIVFALRDRVSVFTGAIVATIMISATLVGFTY